MTVDSLESLADLAEPLGLASLGLMAAVFLVLSLCLLGHCWKSWRGVSVRPRRRSRPHAATPKPGKEESFPLFDGATP